MADTVKKNGGGGKAFPGSYTTTDFYGRETVHVSNGMDLRDWFAGQALAGLFNHGGWVATHDGEGEEVANRAYAVADAMLVARKAGA